MVFIGMQIYKLVPRKDVITAINDILKNKNIEKRFLFLKLTFVVKDADFTPYKFAGISWYGGKNQEGSKLILETHPDQTRFFQKTRDKVFIDVEPNTDAAGVYSVFPFNVSDKDYLQTILELLNDKSYKNLYLVTKYEEPELSLSLNTSVDYGASSLVPSFDNLGKALIEQKEYYEIKLNELNNHIEKLQIDFQQNLDDSRNYLLKDKEQTVAQLQNEINIQKAEIDRLNTCLQNEQNGVNRQKGLVIETQNKLNNLNEEISYFHTQLPIEQKAVRDLQVELKAEQLKVNDLQNQLANTILDRNNWQTRFMEEQVKVGNLQNQLTLSKTEITNLTNQYNLYYQKVHNRNEPKWFDVGDPFIGLFSFDCYTGTLEVNIDRKTHKITYSFPSIS